MLTQLNLDKEFTRRAFLEFMGRSTLALSVLPPFLACAGPGKVAETLRPFTPLRPSEDDALLLADGFNFEILIKYDDPINAKGDRFGFNNDFTAFIPFSAQRPDEGWFWVNHESADPLFVSGWTPGKKRTRDQVRKEMRAVGGSIVHIKKSEGRWLVVKNSRFNRRVSALTKIPFIAPRPIAGSSIATGTLANCAGGITPWRTFLTSEENFHNFYGDHSYDKNGKAIWSPGPEYSGWRDFYKYPPEHYGWVVEVDPRTARAKKLTALGRFSHEGATTVVARDGRTVVYSGDDQADECLYKFIAKTPGSLEQGELFAADVDKGRWLSLDINKSEILKRNFKDQTDVLIRAREAAHRLGASPLDRPEDVKIDPANGSILLSLTNNRKKGNLHGSILKIEEDGGDYLSLNFKATTFLAGGEKTGFSCPDNMVFDRKGNLWLSCDISDSVINKGPYKAFGNNGLFYIPMSGPQAGLVFQVASAPRFAELTGPSFSPDGETLFLSVQHPGEGSTSLEAPLSHWPFGKPNLPKPAVVAISGPQLKALVT